MPPVPLNIGTDGRPFPPCRKTTASCIDLFHLSAPDSRRDLSGTGFERCPGSRGDLGVDAREERRRQQLITWRL